jgi:hypothetical protein
MSYRTVSCAVVCLLCSATAHANTVRRLAGPVQQLLTLNDNNSQSTMTQCSTGLVNIPGAVFKITIPSGPQQLLTARFTAEVEVGGGSTTPIAYGQLVIGTGGTHYLLPGGSLVANSANPDVTTTTAIDRSGVVPGGTTQYVKVQYCVAGGDGTQSFAVTGWHFTVEAAPLQ